MKIAIYGTSRSGKDYLIEHASNHLILLGLRVSHIKGSQLLNQMAEKSYGMKFPKLAEGQKHELRNRFVDFVNEANGSNDIVFVDGHYSFPEEGSFKVVFTDADRDCYDHFFYMDTKSELIREISRKSEGEKQNLEITVEDIDCWKSFEKGAMSKVCELLGKELIILDEDTNSCIEFIATWVLNFEKFYNFEKLAQSAIDSVLLDRSEVPKSALVMDCDNTLSMNDTTFVLCQELGIDKQQLKKIYLGDRYTSYQFFKVNRMLGAFSPKELKLAAQNACDRIELSSQVVDLIESDTHELTLALTSGLLDIWSHKLANELQVDCSLGNSVMDSQLIVTPAFKKAVVKALKAKGIRVTALGDSVIDIPMLEASDLGLLVAHSKLNKAVCSYLKQSESSNLQQVFSTVHKYSIPQVNWSN
ncbi:MAG: AAA family ATPase [bacterium]|nr:AAA family ATPase [bacterium]